MWDDKFEVLMRQHLPFLGPNEDLVPGLDTREFGLDSLGVVNLLMSIEETYNVRIADDALSMETFSTPGVLWDTLSGLLGKAS